MGMSAFDSKELGPESDVTAPDGSEVRVLVATGRGSMAHFTLAPGQVSKAVAHRTIEEIWYITAELGRMWRRLDQDESITDLRPGLSLSIPTGARFQFRCDGDRPLQAIGVAMPPWPGEDEAYGVEGIWPPSL